MVSIAKLEAMPKEPMPTAIRKLPASYESFLTTAKSLANQGEAQQVEKMLLLLRFEGQKALWSKENTSYTEVLRQEGLCTPSTYGAFKNASKILSEAELRKFGVMASAAIGKLDTATRSKVVWKLRGWHKEMKVVPHHQRVTEYVRQLSGKTKAKPKAGVKTLRRHIEKLNKMLAVAGLPVPPVP